MSTQCSAGDPPWNIFDPNRVNPSYTINPSRIIPTQVTIIPSQVFMSEQLYQYRKVLGSNGQWTYERVPWREGDVGDVVMPRPPERKNGEQPGQGSAVVDRILEGMRVAQERREAAEAAEAAQKALQEELKRKKLQPQEVLRADPFKPCRKIEI